MAIPTNINSDITKLSNAKTAIKNAIEAKGVTISSSTALADYITSIGNIPTSSESLTILADIRDALIAIGADIDENTPYSQYASKIGEIQMGDPVTLINNGTNGYYTYNEETGYVTMVYKSDLPTHTAPAASYNIFQQTWTLTLPITFTSEVVLVKYKILTVSSGYLQATYHDESVGTVAGTYSGVNGNQLTVTGMSDTQTQSASVWAYIMGKVS